MIFGQVTNPQEINFALPPDHGQTKEVLQKSNSTLNNICVGCAKWNKTDLKNFYPKGVKDELVYYSAHFNAIELNATFYNMPTKEQVLAWVAKTPKDFKFFPKITNSVSHYKRLINVEDTVAQYIDAVSHFEDKLGMVFLQLHDNFKPKDIDRVEKFIVNFPKSIPLAVELRNEEWFTNMQAANHICTVMQECRVSHIIVDTAGRRDMLHMRLTSPSVFIRYVGANFAGDYTRLDDWLVRLNEWKTAGLENLYFFVHQNVELESPLLAAHFITQMNKQWNISHTIPKTLV
ncbi:MAG: DUF72 domain-containing protein [Cytophagales bacterium]|nr:DUF72 domain-containing protein [Cytophagales bacterium]